MTERTGLADFERRLADELARYVAPARDHRATAQVATEAMLHRRRWAWARVRPRRLILGLAALLLVPLTIAGAASLLRTTPADGYRAVIARPADGGIEVIIADIDGHERTLRRLTPESLGLEPGFVLEQGGSVSQSGWLAISACCQGAGSRRQPRTEVVFLVDLANPGTAPIVLAGNGFMGLRWGPDGQAAMYCGYPPDCGTREVADPNIHTAKAARVLDPAAGAGSEIIVRGIQLHGGLPDMVWAADGSGFLAGPDPTWGTTPLDGGPVVPGFPRVLSRWVGTGRFLDGVDASGIQVRTVSGATERWHHDQLAPAVPVSAQFAADGEAMWLLLSAAPGPLPGLPQEVHSDAPRALLARLNAPGEVSSVTAVPVPSGTVSDFSLSQDDTFAAIHVESGDASRIILASLGPSDPPSAAWTVIDGSLTGLVTASEADTWPSE